MRIKQIKQNKISKVLMTCFSQLQHIFKRETKFFYLWFLKLRKSNISRVNCIVQKQPSRGVLRRRCSKNMHQIYRRTPMPKSDFNKVALQLYENHTSTWVFSCKFVACFQNTFSQEHFWKTASNCCDQLRYKLDQIRQIRLQF